MKEDTSVERKGNLFRTLNAEEIECRVARVAKNKTGPYAQVLLYKDARCDMTLLDETFGPFGWKVNNQEIKGNLYCSVYIKHGEEWVEKQDVGKESNFESEKGEASDAFKRACFRWGIGRELYSAPKIFINLSDNEVYEYQGTMQTTLVLHVSEIAYNEKRRIKTLILMDNNEKVRYVFQEKLSKNKETDSETTTKIKETITPTHKGWKTFVTAVMAYSMTMTSKDIRKRIEEKYFISDTDFNRLYGEATGKEIA